MADDNGTQAESVDLQRVSVLKPAYEHWLDYTKATHDLVDLTRYGLLVTVDMPEVTKMLGSSPERVAALKHQADNATREIESGFATLHAHSLLGVWGALECLVEDIFLAMIQSRPSLLQDERFNKVKLPVAMLAADGPEKHQAILAEVARSSSADLAVGATKFERLLSYVGLGGPVPERVRSAVYEAQQIRNVWAHRGGLADRYLVDRCPFLGLAVGDRVTLTVQHFERLTSGLETYAVVILNRELHSRGMPLTPVIYPEYEDCLAEIGVPDGAP